MTDISRADAILVVDDEPDLLTLYELTLLREGYTVDTAGSVEEAWRLLQARRFKLVITDMRLPDTSGMVLLRRLEEAGRAERVIVVTAYGSAENAVSALKAGAFDYLTKPVDLRQLRGVVSAAMGRKNGPAPAPVAAAVRSAALDRLVGASQAMCQVRSLVQKVARSMAPVLVHGESGTGKELVARAIHEVSARATLPFIAVNCGAIPENLLEAEFFGYRRGAFTGAQEDREGFFQAANHGTLFLDEIGDLPLTMQAKLLRVIQERAVRPVGAVMETPLNVRIVSATHKDLATEVAAGRFRQDLFYRLNVIAITVPALRDRCDDVPLLAAALLSRLAQETGLSVVPVLSAQAQEALQAYAFPGNVRELENMLMRAMALGDHAVIEVADLGLDEVAKEDAERATDVPLAPQAGLWVLPPEEDVVARLIAAPPPAPEVAEPPIAPRVDSLPTHLERYLDDVERGILVRALQEHGFNRTAAGQRLGLTLRQMRYRMARLGITADDCADDTLHDL